jgi:hypothetical protein
MKTTEYFDKAKKEVEMAHLGIKPLRNYKKARCHLAQYLEGATPYQIGASPDLELAKTMLDDVENKIDRIKSVGLFARIRKYIHL